MGQKGKKGSSKKTKLKTNKVVSITTIERLTLNSNVSDLHAPSTSTLGEICKPQSSSMPAIKAAGSTRAGRSKSSKASSSRRHSTPSIKMKNTGQKRRHSSVCKTINTSNATIQECKAKSAKVRKCPGKKKWPNAIHHTRLPAPSTSLPTAQLKRRKQVDSSTKTSVRPTQNESRVQHNNWVDVNQNPSIQELRHKLTPRTEGRRSRPSVKESEKIGYELKLGLARISPVLKHTIKPKSGLTVVSEIRPVRRDVPIYRIDKQQDPHLVRTIKV